MAVHSPLSALCGPTCSYQPLLLGFPQTILISGINLGTSLNCSEIPVGG